MIPAPFGDVGLAVMLAACLLLIGLGYRTDRRQAIAAARRRHPSSRGRA